MQSFHRFAELLDTGCSLGGEPTGLGERIPPAGNKPTHTPRTEPRNQLGQARQRTDVAAVRR